MKTKSINRLLSIILTLSMVFALVQIPSQAAMSGGAEKAKIKLVALEKDAASNDVIGKYGYKVVDPSNYDLSNAAADTPIYMGIQVTGFGNIEEVKDHGLGITGMTVGLRYNDEYIVPTQTGTRYTQLLEKNIGLTYYDEIFEEDVDYWYHHDDNGYTYSISNSGLQNADGIKDTLPVLLYYLEWGGVGDTVTSKYVFNDDDLILVMPFKLVKPAPAGTKVIEFSDYNSLYSLDFGLVSEDGYHAYQMNSTPTGTANPSDDKDILHVIDFDTTGVDFFPAGAKTITGIEVKNAPYSIPQQYAGKALNTAGLELTVKYSDASSSDADMGEVTYKYGATGITDASDSGLTDVPATLTSALNGQYLYAVYKGHIVEVGQLDVDEKTVSNITIKSPDTTFASGNYFSTTNITAALTAVPATEALVVTVEYNTGESEDVSYTAFEGKGLALAKKDTSGNLVAVTAQDKYVTGDVGSNVFYVVQSSDLGKAETGVTIKDDISNTNAVVEDTIVIKKVENAKLKYAEDAAIDFSNADITTYNKSVGDNDATNTTQKVSVIVDDLIFYVGATDVPGDNTYNDGTSTVITSGTTQYTSALKDNYVYVVPADDKTATPVLVGQLGDRAMVSGTVTGAISGTYGDELDTMLQNVSIDVTYDNDDTENIPYAQFTAKNITMKIGDTAVTGLLTPDKTGQALDFYNGVTKVASTTIGTINKKEITYTVTGTNPTKGYDGDNDVDSFSPTIAIDASGLVGADSALNGKIGVTGLTFAYNDKNVGTDKVIKVTGTAVAAKAGTGTDDDVTDFNNKYTLKKGTGFNTDGTELDTIKGTVTAKTLTVSKINNVPVLTVGATTGLVGTKALTLTAENSDILVNDVVSLQYKYEYDAKDVEAAGNPEVTITAAGEYEGVTLGLTGTDAANYTLNATLPTTTGTVTNKTLSGISVNTAPTTVEYTYPNLTLDLSGMKIDYTYEGEAVATTKELADFLADGGQIALTDKEGSNVVITKDNYADTDVTLPYGDVTLTLSYNGKTTTQNVTVNRKPISITDITFNASKVFGNATVTGTYTIADGKLEAADADKVKIEATYTFTDTPESVGENKNVDITNIKLVAGEAGDASDNYVIVDADGNAITADTKVQITNGVITAGEQAAPEKPVVKLDKATNNIIVESPLGENLEYSIDGGKTWQTSPTFTDLAKDTEYKVLARVQATENLNPSAPSESDPVRTYKYYIQALKVNSTTVMAEAYVTDISKVTDDKTLNSEVFGKTPTRFKAYFSDKTGKTALVYPLTDANFTNGEMIIYMSQTASSGGGGGGSSTYTVTYKAGEHGSFADDAVVTEKVTSGKFVAKVPEIVADEGYKFIGWSVDGKEVVDLTSYKITKATTLTALYEEDIEPTVEPTVEPTDKPVIDKNYTKPYAAGYEDGTFLPDNHITRGELAAMIARLSYGDDLPDGIYTASFADVESDAWYNKYIGYLEDLDVLNGYEDGTFRPMNTITRGEISAVITRAQKLEVIPYSGKFSDVFDTDWAKDYIETLASKNIVGGYEDGTFGPYAPLTRAEAVTIINRVLAPSVAVPTFTPVDIAGHWAEADIMLAVNERELIEDAETTPAPEATDVPETEATPAPEAE